jgi:hypothetical protein
MTNINQTQFQIHVTADRKEFKDMADCRSGSTRRTCVLQVQKWLKLSIEHIYAGPNSLLETFPSSSLHGISKKAVQAAHTHIIFSKLFLNLAALLIFIAEYVSVVFRHPFKPDRLLNSVCTHLFYFMLFSTVS